MTHSLRAIRLKQQCRYSNKSYSCRASRLDRFDNDCRFNADEHNVDNPNNGLREIVQYAGTFFKMQREMWQELCNYENIMLAFKKARKYKTTKDYIIEFEKNLEDNLLILRSELLLHSYTPEPLKTFIIRDPKTRKISKSAFRDRVVHHALCNIIEPVFDRCFIYDSYANRLSKGTLKAIQRFDYFKRKVSKNNTKTCYILKVDIKHYFETIDHYILLNIIKRKIKNDDIIRLIKIILRNYPSKEGKGMPLGNLTSQFFANVYLNEFDHFVKRELRAKYYIRYVDDFVMLHNNIRILEDRMMIIKDYLKTHLGLELHPDKSRIIKLNNGTNLLGYRVFYYHKLLRKANKNKFKREFNQRLELYKNGMIGYEDFKQSLQVWFGYAMWANTYKLRKYVMGYIDKNF